MAISLVLVQKKKHNGLQRLDYFTSHRFYCLVLHNLPKTFETIASAQLVCLQRDLLQMVLKNRFVIFT